MNRDWFNFREHVSFKLKLFVTVGLLFCAVMSSLITLVYLAGSLRSLGLDRTTGIVETMRRDVEYAVYIGVPIERLRGLPEYSAVIAAAAPEIRSANIKILNVNDLQDNIDPATGDTETKHVSTGWKRLLEEVEAVLRIVSPSVWGGARDMVTAEVRVYGRPVARITAELDLDYIRGRIADALLDMMVITVAAILLALEVAMIPAVYRMMAPLQAIQRHLAHMRAKELIVSSRVPSSGGAGWAFMRRLQARNSALLSKAEGFLGHAGDGALRGFIAHNFLLRERMADASIFDARLPIFLCLFAEGLLTSWMPLHTSALANDYCSWMSNAVASATPIAAFTAAVLITTLSANVWVPRTGFRILAAGGAGIAVVGMIGSAFVLDIALLTLTRTTSGLGLGIIQLACINYFTALPEEAADYHELNGFKKAFMTAAICGLGVGAVLADWIGSRGVFLIAGGVGAVALICALTFMDPAIQLKRDQHGGAGLRPILALMVRPHLALMMLLLALPLAMLENGFIFFLAPLAMSQMGMSQSAIGHGLIAYAVLMLPAYIIWSSVLKRYTKWFLLAAGLLILFGVMLWGLGTETRTQIWIWVILAMGFLAGITTALLSRAHSLTAAKDFSTDQIELQKSIRSQLGGATGPLVAGFMLGTLGIKQTLHSLGTLLILSGIALLIVFGTVQTKRNTNA